MTKGSATPARSARRGLTLTGGAKPKLRRVGKGRWTKTKERLFLEALAETCNVRRACRVAAVSRTQAYRRRGNNATFRAAWGQALALAYAQIEMLLLERALHGVEKIVDLKNGESRTIREYSDSTALALMRMHRDSAAAHEAGVSEQDYKEALERILARLARLKEREATKALPAT